MKTTLQILILSILATFVPADEITGLNLRTAAGSQAVNPTAVAGAVLSLDANKKPTLGGGIGIDSTGVLTFNSNAYFGSPSAATFRLGTADAATPIAQTISVQSASGVADTAGVMTYLDLSRSTGTGDGGGFTIRGTPGTNGYNPGSGSTQGTLRNIFQFLPDGGAADYARIGNSVFNVGTWITMGDSAAYFSRGDTPTLAHAAISGGGDAAGYLNLGSHGVAGAYPGISFRNSTSNLQASSLADAWITRPAAAEIRFGYYNSASPVAQTLSVQNVVTGTANTAGANLTINGSQSTGNAEGGSIVFQTAPAGGAGGAQNALVEGLAIESIAGSGNFASTVPQVTLFDTYALRKTTGYGLALTNAAGNSLASLTLSDISAANAAGVGGYLAVGVAVFAVDDAFSDPGVHVNSISTIDFSSGAATHTKGDTLLSRDSAAIFQLGEDHATTPTAQAIKAHDVTTGTGASMTIAGGKGSVAGGSVILATSVTNGTAGTRNLVRADEITLTEATATVVANIAIADGKYVGGELIVTTHADDGTDFQAITEHLTFSAVNKAGTVTATIQAAPSTSTLAASAGTLTTTWAATANGNSVDITNYADSSLSQTTLKCSYQLRINTDGAGVVTP